MNRNRNIDKLFRLYYRPLCLYATLYISDSNEVEDIVQSSFISLWEHCQDGLEPDSAKSYLYKTVHNKCIDSLRATVKSDKTDIEAIGNIPAEEDVDRSEIRAQLWMAIDRLPRQCRKIFLMSKKQGLSHASIALQLGISENTVHNQISKALKILRRQRTNIIKFFIF